MFLILILSYIIVIYARNIILLFQMLETTTNLHMKMTKKVLTARLQFFEENEKGKILTRFSKD